MATTSVILSGGFPSGTKARAYLRASDTFSPGQHVVSSATADKNGRISLKGLDVGVLYFVQIGDELSARTVQAKDAGFSDDANLHRDGPEATVRRLQADRNAQAAAREKAEAKNPLAASPAPGRTVEDNRPKRRSPSVAEPQPGPRQQETSGPQRSDTPDGTGVPKDPKEPVPDVRQEDVGPSTPQRSSTDTGVATVKDRGEQAPAAAQSDVPASTPQRSSTPEGEAAPKPKVKGANVQKRRDASKSRARGRTARKPEEAVKPKGTVRKTTRTGTPKRSSRKR